MLVILQPPALQAFNVLFSIITGDICLLVMFRFEIFGAEFITDQGSIHVVSHSSVTGRMGKVSKTLVSAVSGVGNGGHASAMGYGTKDLGNAGGGDKPITSISYFEGYTTTKGYEPLLLVNSKDNHVRIFMYV